MSDSNPTCIWVWESEYRVVCTEWCTCYRGNRPAIDQNHCFRMLIAVDGRRGFCTRDLDGLKRARVEAIRKKQGGSQ